MPGIVELAEQVFEMPVRLGVPQGVGGLSANVADPRFSTGVGLVIHGAKPEGRESGIPVGPPRPFKQGFDIKQLFANLF
jgi:cell division protein FtsA